MMAMAGAQLLTMVSLSVAAACTLLLIWLAWARLCEAVGHRVISRQQVGRNEPCPCESGRKFKRCHGRRRQQGA